MPGVPTIFTAPWIFPASANLDTLLYDYALIVEREKIINLLPAQQANKYYPNARITDYPGQIMLPGLINAHTHSPMSLLRGFADELPLTQWLEDHIWPAEAEFIDEEFVASGSKLAVAEMLLGGTTMFSDMYFYPDITAEVVQTTGMRAMLGLPILDFPSLWAKDSAEYFDRAIQIHDQLRSYSRVLTALAPHAPYTVGDESLRKILTYADELQIPVHMHVHETREEIDNSINQYGCRPLERLNKLGLLNPRLIAVHMTQLNDDEINLLAETGVSVVHCPISNAKLASGRCPIERLHQHNINTALGTDGAASNNSLNLFQEMKFASLFSKSGSGNASVSEAVTILNMATLAAAKAMNVDDKVGSLEPGKAADFISVDLHTIQTSPVFDPISQLVYAADRQQVRNVWVNGEPVVTDGTLNTLDLDQLNNQVQQWQQQLQNFKKTKT